MLSRRARILRRHGLSAWFLLCVLWLIAAPAAADTVSLRNGDRLTGELVGLKHGVLTLKTPYAGTVKVPVAEIASMATDEPVTLRLASGASGTGRIAASAPGNVWLHDVEGVAAGDMKLQEIAEIRPGADTEGGFRWSGRVNFGAEQRSGNTDTMGVHFDGEMTGVAEENRLRLRGDFNRELDDSTRTEDDFSAFAQHDYFITGKLFLYGNAQVEHDRPADLRLRTRLGTGAGWQALATGTTSLSLEAGPAYVIENHYAGPDRDYPAGRWAVNFDHSFWGGGMLLFHRHEGTVEFGDTGNTFIDSSSGLRFPIGNGFNFTAQADIDWDSDPAPEASSMDKRYLLTLGYSW